MNQPYWGHHPSPVALEMRDGVPGRHTPPEEDAVDNRVLPWKWGSRCNVATPRVGSLPGTVNGAGDEPGWLVTPRKPCDEVVDAVVGVEERAEVVLLAC